MIAAAREMQQILNVTGLAEKMTLVQNALAASAISQLKVTSPEGPPSLREQDTFLLNSVGPAAAGSAVEYAIKACVNSGKLANLRLTTNMAYNAIQVTQNTEEAEYEDYSNVLRQYLLPRSAYFSFDNLVDPRHQIDVECGYPKFITPIMYRYMYDRDDVACRVVDIYPDETWVSDPDIFDSDDEEKDTPFEEDIKELSVKKHFLQNLYRLDRLAGIGHYGILLIGLDDGKDLADPVDEAALLAGDEQSVGKTQRKVLYFRPFDEYLSFIQEYETDSNNPRYGRPKYYNLVFLDMTIDAAGSSVGTRLNRRVHWTRVIHYADNHQSSEVFGRPRQQPPFNRLLDLRKIKGGSGEMFWKGAFPGLSFEIDPRIVEDNPDFDRDKFRKEIQDYSNGLQRYISLVGISAKSLAPQVADPRNHVQVQIEAVASHSGVPTRIFMGSEEARLSSSEDRLSWNRRLTRRINKVVNPYLIRNAVDRLVALGCVRPPADMKKSYSVEWPDLNTPTDEDKANLALKWTQALSQYVASGVAHLIHPKDYLTMILGLKPRDALTVLKSTDVQKLLKVDPSQGAGVNGKRTDQVGGKDTGTSRTRDTERPTADKKAEGKTS